ncbi:hypothetical protein MSKU9_0561 [Komagataeibacter diospyri]|uniref:Uncharacterized protein n=1 Tax=Komagataeibacter diospyri TaxID=1932662 RepID=A0A4P5NL23_9PROT|nr:hypothetical protein MSKU9_0561 [Komagataeibacter diospyri]
MEICPYVWNFREVVLAFAPYNSSSLHLTAHYGMLQAGMDVVILPILKQ